MNNDKVEEVGLVATEDKLQLPPNSSEDKKKAQKELALLHKRLRKNRVFKTTHKWTGFQGKTLWDWMQLLLIPLVLTAGGFLFSTCQHDADQKQALDQQQATTLQTYIDNIQDLLLNYHLSTKPTLDVQELARARTLTALRGLDPKRKGLLVQFLDNANLINSHQTDTLKPPETIIYLTGADLSYADLSHAVLSSDSLVQTNLTSANLSNALVGATDFYGANLSNANLTGAALAFDNFDRANLDGANLYNANLSGATFINANLSNVLGLTQQQLNEVYSCKDATLPEGLTCNSQLPE